MGIMYWLLYKHIFREQELILTTTPSLKYTINSAGIQLFNTVNSLSLSEIKITEATTMLYLRDVLQRFSFKSERGDCMLTQLNSY